MFNHMTFLHQANTNLGIQVRRSLKAAVQVDKVVTKVFGMFPFTGRGIEFNSKDIMLELYKTQVRSQLECCGQFWSPYYRNDVMESERAEEVHLNVARAGKVSL